VVVLVSQSNFANSSGVSLSSTFGVQHLSINSISAGGIGLYFSMSAKIG
jgi:hypothetical protein